MNGASFNGSHVTHGLNFSYRRTLTAASQRLRTRCQCESFVRMLGCSRGARCNGHRWSEQFNYGTTCLQRGILMMDTCLLWAERDMHSYCDPVQANGWLSCKVMIALNGFVLSRSRTTTGLLQRPQVARSTCGMSVQAVTSTHITAMTRTLPVQSFIHTFITS